MRVRCLRAQQQCRRIDRAASHDVVARLDADHGTGWRAPIFTECVTGQCLNLVRSMLNLAHAQAVQQRRTVGQRRRNRRHQHRLLGIGRAAIAAIAGIQAALDVARDDVRLPSQRLAATLQDAVVLVRCQAARGNGEALLHPGKPGRHLFFAVAHHAMLRGPVGEGLIRGAKTRSPVHRGGAANTATLQDRNGAVRCGASGTFLVEVAVSARFVHVLEMVRGLERTFLDHDDLESGQTQNFSRHTAAGTGTDDGDVRLKREGLLQGRCINDLPTRRDTCGVNIGICHGFLSNDLVSCNQARCLRRRIRNWRPQRLP